MASHCTSCLLVCHNKCLPRVETSCSQHPPIDDSVYEVSVLSGNSSNEFKIRGNFAAVGNLISFRMSAYNKFSILDTEYIQICLRSKGKVN